MPRRSSGRSSAACAGSTGPGGSGEPAAPAARPRPVQPRRRPRGPAPLPLRGLGRPGGLAGGPGAVGARDRAEYHPRAVGAAARHRRERAEGAAVTRDPAGQPDPTKVTSTVDERFLAALALETHAAIAATRP